MKKKGSKTLSHHNKIKNLLSVSTFFSQNVEKNMCEEFQKRKKK